MRVFVVDTTSYFLANKDRFNSRMAYGIGDGLNRISSLTADVKPDASGPYKGKKVLRVTEFSARGARSSCISWDPIGPDGFADIYTKVVSSAARRHGVRLQPRHRHVPSPCARTTKNLQDRPRLRGRQEMVGTIALSPPMR